MKILRLGFVGCLLVPMVVPYDPSSGDPHFLLWRDLLDDWDYSRVENALSTLLRPQGKDARAYLAWQKNSSFFVPWKTERLTSGGNHYTVLNMGQFGGFSIPGEWVERHLLFDSKGALLDVATVVRPTRLLERFAWVDSASRAAGCFREIHDLKSESPWGHYDPPYILLGLEEGPRRRDAFAWTGSARLGSLWVDGGAFRVQRE